MTTANYITLSRLLISPLFLLIYVNYEKLGMTLSILPYVLVTLLGISELSDSIDGYIARKYNQITDFGKIIDPMADSVTHISIFLAFSRPPVSLPIELTFIFFYRDSIISSLRTICALQGITLAARISGKIKSVLQGVASLLITLLLIPYSAGYLSHETLQLLSMYLVGIVAFYSVFSGLEYLFVNRVLIKKVIAVDKISNG
ncbi:MAG: pgsa3 [Chlamydiales bacterium]|nr:pgsa3 [Chlamydiales bacterium]